MRKDRIKPESSKSLTIFRFNWQKITKIFKSLRFHPMPVLGIIADVLNGLMTPASSISVIVLTSRTAIKGKYQ